MTILSVPTKGWAYMRNGFSFVHELTAHLFEADPVDAANQEYYNGERVRIETVNSRNTVTNGVINVTREAMLDMAFKIINDPDFNPEQVITFDEPDACQSDVTLVDNSMWVRVGPLQLYIRYAGGDDDGGVIIDVFGESVEGDEIDSLYVPFAAAFEEESDE